MVRIALVLTISAQKSKLHPHCILTEEEFFVMRFIAVFGIFAAKIRVREGNVVPICVYANILWVTTRDLLLQMLDSGFLDWQQISRNKYVWLSFELWGNRWRARNL